MARARQAAATANLEARLADYQGAAEAKAKARAALDAAMVRCVRAGLSRREVARLTGTSPQWVRTVPGMPPSNGDR